ncbi:MAG: hypothetical protein CK427_07215 [Leptospira sp.]|nr:MAG: hypothetical protein CK427_07215 [Leptospira sp.]
MIRRFWLPFIFVLAIALGNIYILTSSQSAILKYSENPPFRLDDFTKSYRISSDSKLSFLLDKDPSSSWQKLAEGLDDKDFELELRLTHRWNGKEFSPKLPESLVISTCSNSKLILSIILREAINIDKELRLPQDSLVFTQETDTQIDGTINIPLDSIRKKLKPTSNYPEGISILTLRGKFLGVDGCLREVGLIQ